MDSRATWSSNYVSVESEINCLKYSGADSTCVWGKRGFEQVCRIKTTLLRNKYYCWRDKTSICWKNNSDFTIISGFNSQRRWFIFMEIDKRRNLKTLQLKTYEITILWLKIFLQSKAWNDLMWLWDVRVSVSAQSK